MVSVTSRLVLTAHASTIQSHCYRAARGNGVSQLGFLLASCYCKGKITIVLLVQHLVVLNRCPLWRED